MDYVYAQDRRVLSILYIFIIQKRQYTHVAYMCGGDSISNSTDIMYIIYIFFQCIIISFKNSKIYCLLR